MPNTAFIPTPVKRRRGRLIGLLLTACFVCGLCFSLGFTLGGPARPATAPLSEATFAEAVTVLALQSLAAEAPPPASANADASPYAALLTRYPAVQALIERPQDYPASLRELLLRNEETVDFVLGYPHRQPAQAIDISGDISPGVLPLFLQWDARWGYETYGDDMLALTACGPTSLAMVAVALTGNPAYHPLAVARMSEAAGYYVSGVGSSWQLMHEGAASLGLLSQELPLSEQVIKQSLEAGQPVICSMRKGDFTQNGHFIVLAAVSDNGGFIVHDPNSPARSAKIWDYDTLAPQIANIWAFSRR